MMKWGTQAKRLAALTLITACAACSGAFQKSSDYKFGAREISFADLDGWNQDNHDESIATFLVSCSIMANKPRPTSDSNITISKDTWRSLCQDAKKSAAGGREQAREFFERRFTPFRISNKGTEKGLFTGYYIPVLYGSTTKYKDFKYPLYAAPPGLENKKPYLTHAQIAKGGLNGKGLELLYVDDPVMLFFLQIQGSGRVKMRDGRTLFVGYAGQNGHEYTSLGKIMGDESLIPKDKINFFTIRQWLYDHPDRAMGLMQRNPSYVFFKILEREQIVGSIGAPLTPWRSMAVDRRFIPYGLPLFLETDLPPMPGGTASNFHRLMMAQDTGGAIRGPVRGDIFFGSGDSAEYMAGYMKGKGIYSLLVPKESAHQLR